jgi:hypothetical protein
MLARTEPGELGLHSHVKDHSIPAHHDLLDGEQRVIRNNHPPCCPRHIEAGIQTSEHAPLFEIRIVRLAKPGPFFFTVRHI